MFPLPLLLLIAAPLAAAGAGSQHVPGPAGLGPVPVVPDAPPPPAVIPTPDLAPPHPTAPPPPPVVSKHAEGALTRTKSGLRVTFGAGSSDLNPATAKALGDLAHLGHLDHDMVYNLYAHARGEPDDMSSPRRLSLARGLSVRSALINNGIVSTRIYVHALGATGLDGSAPDDRVDIALTRQSDDKPIVLSQSAWALFPLPESSDPASESPATP